MKFIPQRPGAKELPRPESDVNEAEVERLYGEFVVESGRAADRLISRHLLRALARVAVRRYAPKP